MQLPSRIYHIAIASNWPFIEQHGLLSTCALLERFEASEAERARVLHHRAEQITLHNGIIIRDQKPMPPAALERCLHGIPPQQWYDLLNSKVFFWCDVERMNRLLLALRGYEQIVLSLDTTRLVAAYAPQIALTPINTGNARRQPAQRGPSTFVPYATWLESGWTSEVQEPGARPRPRSHRPVELTVEHAVPDVLDFVVGMSRLQPGETYSEESIE